jgi:2-oxoglutarate ferredoxin oxidoreductase subunit alpha
MTVINRTPPDCPPEEYLPYKHTASGVPPMANFGTGYRYHVTGLFHDETGFQTNNSVEIDKLLRRLHRKIDQARDEIVQVDAYMMEDAEIGIVAYGSSARASRYAVRLAREKGIKVGLLRPKTMWPFMDKEIQSYAEQIKTWLVPELNLGQVAHEVEWALMGHGTVHKLNRVDGNLIEPPQILAKIEEIR